MKAKVKVTLKKNILDPQGKAVLHAINEMKYGDVSDVRIGKFVEIEFKNGDRDSIKKEVDEICQKLLANPNMENYEFELEDES